MTERMQMIAEEIADVQSLEELEALVCFGQSEGNEYVDPELLPVLEEALERLRYAVPTAVAESVAEPVVEARVRVAVAPIVRGGRKYRLLSLDVGWSTKPQVHAIAAILAAHGKVGDVLDESAIVEAMVANEEVVLQTKQGGKRIWDYYKGTNAEGLQAHGNVERI